MTTTLPTLPLPTFLPGTLTLRPGIRPDFHALARFHYLPKPPATFAQIWTLTYTDPAPSPTGNWQLATGNSRIVAVAVLSYPTPRNRAREHYFRTAHLSYRDQILFANAHLRTLSRLIVHPQFRSLGLASLLTRHTCAHSPTRYTESLATMARAHPFFERAGLTPITPPNSPEDAPLYFLHDKAGPMTNSEFPNDESMPNPQ